MFRIDDSPASKHLEDMLKEGTISRFRYKKILTFFDKYYSGLKEIDKLSAHTDRFIRLWRKDFDRSIEEDLKFNKAVKNKMHSVVASIYRKKIRPVEENERIHNKIWNRY